MTFLSAPLSSPSGGAVSRRLTERALSGRADPHLIFCYRVLPPHLGDFHIFQRRLGVRGVPLQGGEDGVVHGGKDRPLAAELYLGLGGVDVHVHGVELGPQMEDAPGEFAHHPLVLIGLLHGGHHQGGFYLTAIDKEELPVPAVPAAGGHGDKAGHGHILAGGLDLPEAQGQLPAQHGVGGAFQLAVPGGKQLLLAVPDEFYRDLRVGQRHPLDHGKDGGALGGVFFHEFQPGGGVEKQVPDHHGGAQGTARLLHRSRHASLQRQGGPQVRLRRPGKHLNAGDGGDGGKRLPPEAQGSDGLQVVFGAQLAGGVAEKGGFQLRGRDALPVVGHPEEGEPAVVDLHRHGGGPGVNGVFHQLLGHRGGPLHHLTGGNQVGYMGV